MLSTEHPLWLRQLPNALTASRLAAIPLIAYLVAIADGATSQAPGWVFAAVAVTDLVDGTLARRLGVESRFGRIADPLCDRLLVAVGLVGLLVLGNVNPVAPIALLTRDASALVAFPLLARRGVDIGVDALGKASSGLVMLAIPLCIGYRPRWLEVLLWVAVAGSVVSFANYARRVNVALRGGADRGVQ